MPFETVLFVAAMALLTGLNVAQFIFWSGHTQKLVDKLMSRNYAEYSLAHASSQAPKTERDAPLIDLGPSEDVGSRVGFGV